MKKNVKYMEEWKGEGGDTQGQNEERMRQSERERGGGGIAAVATAASWWEGLVSMI